MTALSAEDKYYYRELNIGLMELACAAPGDFYELLGVSINADKDEIKASFRRLQRIIHPDIAGQSGHDMSILLNSAYQTLMDDQASAVYRREVQAFREDQGGSFMNVPVSSWAGPETEQRAVFVDESVCIGCRNCTHSAPDTFVMEEDFGRARVSMQWGNQEEFITEAVDMCPVDCIHYVQRSQLALLEHMMKSCPREDIAIMARRRSGNMGPARSSESPFTRADVFLKHRKDARLGLLDDTLIKNAQNSMLAGLISRAYLQLPSELQEKGWGEWIKYQLENGGDDESRVYTWKDYAN